MANKNLRIQGGTIWSDDVDGGIPGRGDLNGPLFYWNPEKNAFRAGYLYHWPDASFPSGDKITMWDDPNYIGYGSAAFGSLAEASGDYSLASGNVTQATGYGSQAHGLYSSAKDDYAVAIGLHSEATGFASQAHGQQTKAHSNYAMAFGNNVVIGEEGVLPDRGQHSFGYGFGNNIKDDYGFGVGYGINLNHDPNDNVYSLFSRAFGFGHQINSSNTSSFGQGITVGKDSQYGFLSGFLLTTADNSGNAFMHGVGLGVGVTSVPSMPIDENAIQNSGFAMAMGCGSFVGENSPFSVILPSDGSKIIQGSSFSFSYGSENETSGSDYSFAQGSGVQIISSDNSFVNGHTSSVTSSQHGFIRGVDNSILNGAYVSLEGFDNDTVNAWYARAKGNLNKVNNSSYADAYGLSNDVTGSQFAYVWGNDNNVQNSIYGHANGWNNQVLDTHFAYAIGCGNIIDSSVGSMVIGDDNRLETKANSYTQGFTFVTGSGNLVQDVPGEPTSNNLVTGSANTVIGAMCSLVGGHNSTSTANYTVSFGLNCVTEGFASVALGNNARSYGEHAFAIGSDVAVGSSGSDNIGFALGSNSTVTGFASGSLGNSLLVTGDNAFAIGSGDSSTLTNAEDKTLVVGFRNEHTFKVEDNANRRGVEINGGVRLKEINAVAGANVAVTDPLMGCLYHDQDQLLWTTTQGTVVLAQGATAASPWTISGGNLFRSSGVGIQTSALDAGTTFQVGANGAGQKSVFYADSTTNDNFVVKDDAGVDRFKVSANAQETTVQGKLVTDQLNVSGGTNGQVLTNDGSGNAVWGTSASDKNFAEDNLTLNGNRTHSLAQYDLIYNQGLVTFGTGLAGEGAKVNGEFHFTDGNQGANKILVSDANGKASWQDKDPADGNISTQDYTFANNRTNNLATNTLAFNGGILSVGTGLAGEELHVNGKLKYTDGTQGANKVLTSDANGEASWQTAGGDKTLATDDLLQAYEPRNYNLNTQNLLFVNGTMEVQANLKVTSGTPGSGKVLTSDASGNATWQTPSGGGSTQTKSYLSFALPSQVSGTLAGFSKAVTLATGGMAPTSSPWSPVGVSGDNDPYIVHQDCKITSVRVNLTNIAVGTGTVGTDVKIRVQVFGLNYNSRTLLGTFDIPVDETKVNVWNDVGSGANVQSAVLGGQSVQLYAGDMIGLQFTNLPTNNDGINAIAKAFASVELTND